MKRAPRRSGKRVLDVSVFLAAARLARAAGGPRAPLKIAYHDACHLANAQGVRREPRELLRAIPGVELCELADAQICCGSAGTYNLDQPEIAASLGEKKARAVIATGAEVVAQETSAASRNCACTWRSSVRRFRSRHTMQVLRDAYHQPVRRRLRRQRNATFWPASSDKMRTGGQRMRTALRYRMKRVAQKSAVCLMFAAIAMLWSGCAGNQKVTVLDTVYPAKTVKRFTDRT